MGYPEDLSELTTATISNTPRQLTMAGLADRPQLATTWVCVSVWDRRVACYQHCRDRPGLQSFRRRIPTEFTNVSPWWLQANRVSLQGLGNGATFKEVSKTVVSRLRLSTSTFVPEQRRLADILDQADTLRAKRRAVLAELETLTQSVFLRHDWGSTANPKDGSPLDRCRLTTALTTA